MVLTLCTERADCICKENGLSFTQLIRPFTKLENINAHIRTPSHTINLNDFNLRFESPSALEPPSIQSSNELFASKVLSMEPELIPRNTANSHTSTSQESSELVPATPEDAVAALRRVRPKRQSDWYSWWRNEVVETTRCQEHEMFDHPVVLLLVVSSDDPSPIVCFDELAMGHHLPAPFKRHQYDSADTSMQRFYLLLHDNCRSTATTQAEVTMRQMRSNYSPTRCFQLSLNSIPPTSPNINSNDIWSANLRTGEKAMDLMHNGKPLNIGAFLSDADIKAWSDFVRTFAVKAVLPALERRILDLSKEIKAQRVRFQN